MLPVVRLFLSLLIGCLGAASAWAEIATIRLHDGSSIRGEIISLKHGNYRVQSMSLGTIDIKQSDVRIVEYTPAGAPASTSAPVPLAAPSQPNAGAQPTNPALAAQMQSVQQSMLSNPAIMQMVQGLQGDPAVQAVLADPAIRRAINSGDYGSLMSNPKIRALMNNRQVQAITQQVR